MPRPPESSPWRWHADDYAGLEIRIAVEYDLVTRLLLSSTVSRDSDCQYTKIVIGQPSLGLSKRLPASIDGALDRVYSAPQMASQGLTTIEDVWALQITAEP